MLHIKPASDSDYMLEGGPNLEPLCVHCGELRYPQDEYCMGCGEEWTCSYLAQPLSLPTYSDDIGVDVEFTEELDAFLASDKYCF